jgi:hypothetical protein
MPRKLVPALLVALAVLALPAAGGGASDPSAGDGAERRAGDGYAPGGGEESTRGNPCLTPRRRALLCPDLNIAKPFDIYVDTVTRPGRRLLRAANNIRSRGAGPVEIRGKRISRLSMSVTQRIHRRGGGKLAIRTTGRVDFYPVPGQYRYWKYRDAAAFEIWSVGSRGRPVERLRRGPKLHYCLRDLERTRPSRRSPPRRVYPACSQDLGRRSVVLGTSVGWSDIYPATYHQNWINVTGLRGCFAFFHVVDPKNHIRELNERNNRSKVFIRLPSARVVSSCPRRDTGGIG